MKTSLVLELTKTYTVKDSEISVVSRKIDKYKKVLWALRALIVG